MDAGRLTGLCIILWMVKLVQLSLFEKNHAIVDVTCEVDNIVFTEEAKSRIGCQATCDETDGCYSTFFSSGTNSCVGCSVVYATSTGLPPQIGTTYYSKPAPECPTDWTAYSNTCYQLVTEELSMNDAKTNCASLHDDAHLVDIKTDGEMGFLIELYNTLTNQDTTRVWIGAFTSSPQGPESYLWTDGTRMVDGFNDFLFTYIRSCVFFDPTRDFVWENAPCSRAYWSVCEYDITP